MTVRAFVGGALMACCLSSGLLTLWLAAFLGGFVPYGLQWVNTASISKGVYLARHVESTEQLRLGGVYCFRYTPTALTQHLEQFAAGDSICKYLLAGPADAVALRDGVLHVSSRVLPLQPKTSTGQPLQSAWPESYTQLPAESYFVFSPLPRSFDSRYFGAVPRSAFHLQLVRSLWLYD